MDAILIKNGWIVDSENAEYEKGDIAVEDGKIRAMGPELSGKAVSEIDAGGCFVVPGLIDHHTHISPMSSIGISGEAACFGAGVTTAVDAGSTGCDTYERYREWIAMEKLEIFSYLHVCSTGLSSLPAAMEDVDPAHMDEGKLREMFNKHGKELLGLKIRISRGIVKERGLEPLKAAAALGERLQVPLMVHITDPPAPIPQVLSILRPGDIVTHMYQNMGNSILEDGRVSDAVWAARERGIRFEAADARAHFSFETAEAAIREGFYPDLLGTDITRLSMHLRPTAFNMAMQISKYAYLGIPFPELIRIAAWKNAREIGISDRVGSLRPGKQADIAVFRPRELPVTFGDRPYTTPTAVLREGTLVYEPVLTIKNGEMVYRSVTF